MSDYDCTNCEWIIDKDEIKCMNTSNMIDKNTNDASDLDISRTNMCDPRCYEFKPNYLKNNYYNNVYKRILLGLSDASAPKLNKLRNDIYEDDIYKINTNASASFNDINTKKIIKYNSDSDSQCTNKNLVDKVSAHIDDVTQNNDNAKINLTLPEVDKDQLKSILNETSKDITTIEIDDSYDYRNVYNNLVPDETNKNSNIWPCNDSDGNNITDSEVIINTEFTNKYKKICNPSKNFLSASDIDDIIKDKCGNDSSYKKNYEYNQIACDKLDIDNFQDIKSIIRQSTLDAITGLQPKYIKQNNKNFDQNISEEEIQNYFTHSETYDDDDDMMPSDIPDEAINTLNDPTSEEYRSLSDMLSDNYRFRNCIDEILYTGDNDGLKIERIKNTNLSYYTDQDFDYISRKLDRLISIRPYDIESCLGLINNVDNYICQGVISTSVFNIVNMIVSLFGIQTDIYKIVEGSDEDKNFKKLLDIIIPKIPILIKRLLDMARYFETDKCNG